MSLAVVLAYNPKSGSALSLPKLRALCKTNGITITNTVSVRGNLAAGLKPHIARGANIMAIGGDGTLSNVAALLVGTKSTLIPLPGGTFNNFTKDLGIPQNVEQAIANAATAKTHTVDIAEVNGTYFLNNSSIGLYPRSLRTRKRLADRLGKWPAALFAVVRAFLRHRTYSVIINNETIDTSFIYIGNNVYTINGLDLPRRTAVNEGVLTALIFKSRSRLGLAKSFLAAAYNSARSDRSFTQITATNLTIGSKKHSHVYVSHDGEVTKTTMPLVYTLHKKALRVAY